MSNKNFGFGTQIRKSPYFDATVRWGATGFSVYNHMYIPRDFGDPEQNFWNLIKTAILIITQVQPVMVKLESKFHDCEYRNVQGNTRI